MRARYYEISPDAQWLDIGFSECERCGVHRRLYRPVNRLDVYVCAPCSQIVVNASREGYCPGDEDELDEVSA